MKRNHLGPLELWQFESLAASNDLVHFVSGRNGGVTSGEKGSLNLSFNIGDDPENVRKNRQRLSDGLGISAERLLIPGQTHSLNVLKVADGTENLSDTDALITCSREICIAVLSADCVPVLLYDPVRKAGAAVHAGWRGTVGGILTNTIKAMVKEYKTSPADLMAGIGPSICPDVYEVGPEVIAEVENKFGANSLLIRQGIGDKGFLNLWEANRILLLSAGVRSENIEVAGVCTYSNPDLFFSARRSRNNTGRFAAGLMIR